MLRILLIKTSSLGDVVHNLPVVTDIHRQFPHATIDWVVEESYTPLARLHPAVGSVIPVAVRRWRRTLLNRATWNDMGAFRRRLRAENYDVVIDTQGLIKSALIARSAHGRSHGFDASSARESLAAHFYDATHHVAKGQHAVLRNRQLAAAALGYRVGDVTDYGLSGLNRSKISSVPYCVLLHGTSRADKLWSADAWIELGGRLASHGFMCVLPWGDEAERKRSEQIAASLGNASVPAKMPLDDMVQLLAASAAVVGVDTGLVHLAAALGLPVVAIFVGSDPALTGVFGVPHCRNLGIHGTAPSPASVFDALAELRVF